MIGILLSPEGDLEIGADGLVLGDIRQDIAERVLLSNRGEYKEYPLLGCEIYKITGGVVDAFWKQDSLTTLKACGLEVNKITIEPNGIIIE